MGSNYEKKNQLNSLFEGNYRLSGIYITIRLKMKQ